MEIPKEEIEKIKLIVERATLYDYEARKHIINFHNSYLPYKKEREECMPCVMKAYKRIKEYLDEENNRHIY